MPEIEYLECNLVRRIFNFGACIRDVTLLRKFGVKRPDYYERVQGRFNNCGKVYRQVVAAHLAG